jgi:hypothetical protein
MIGQSSRHRAGAPPGELRPFWDRREPVTIVNRGALPLLFSAF